MQTNCDIFNCGELNPLNYCSDGLIAEIPIFDGEEIFCYIKVGGVEYCQTVTVINNQAKVNWKPSEYLPRGIYKAEVTFKHTDYDFLYVYNIHILPTCEEAEIEEVIAPDTCEWVLTIKTCNWTLKQNSMITVIYNGKQIKLNTSPKDGAFVNDDFLDELDAIEQDAFSVSLNGQDVLITYIGLAETEILVGCNKILKTCN